MPSPEFAADNPNHTEQLQAFFLNLDKLEQPKQAAAVQETIIGDKGSAADAVVIKGYKILQPVAAGGIAFLAMSHFQLGNKDEANKYREQLFVAMKLDAFKDDEDCQNFVQEVDILFEGSPIETQPGKNVGADSNPAP